MPSTPAECLCAPSRQLWQLFESVRQHFTSSSVGPARTLAAGSINVATHKAVVDGVRAASEDSDDAALQQPQGLAEECPGAQQASSSTDRKKRRQGNVMHAIQLDTTKTDDDDEAAIQPSTCQAPQAAVKEGPSGVHMIHQRSIDSGGSKQRPDALAQRVCPVFGHFAVQELSLCHLLDMHVDHSCRTAVDCGVDSVTCRARECSVHGFCQEEPK